MSSPAGRRSSHVRYAPKATFGHQNAIGRDGPISEIALALMTAERVACRASLFNNQQNSTVNLVPWLLSPRSIRNSPTRARARNLGEFGVEFREVGGAARPAHQIPAATARAAGCRQGGRKPINAKCETVQELPTFRDAYRRPRCIVPVDGFFEWKAIKGRKAKQPYAIAMKDGKPFGIGGLSSTPILLHLGQ